MPFVEIQPIVDDFAPRCIALAEGRYALAIGGSFGRMNSDHRSDLDFRLYCDAVVSDPEERARRQADVDEAVREWAARGVVLDGCWVRNIPRISRELEQWRRGVIAPEDRVWTVWGYFLPTDIANLAVVDDPYGVIEAWRGALTPYPPLLKQALLERHLGRVRYWRQDYHYPNKVQRQDIVFLASLSARLVHDLIQILFALNEIYYVGDGNNLAFVQKFALLPAGFIDGVTQALYPGQGAGMYEAQYDRLMELTDSVESLLKQERVGV